jgi:hypothetical protein
MSTTQSQNENPNYFTAMAGEFYVLAQLFQKGYIGSLTYGNAKSVDILVSAKSGKMFKLEVKTTGSDCAVGSVKSQFDRNYEWTMSEGHEDIIDENLYYCFVILKGYDELPKFFFVSNQQVAQYMKDEYRHWLKIRKKEFKSHNRAFRLALNPESSKLRGLPFIPAKDHEGRWDILPK